MTTVERLQARARSYRQAEAIALGLLATADRWGLPTTVASMRARADEAARQARRAERELAKVETNR